LLKATAAQLSAGEESEATGEKLVGGPDRGAATHRQPAPQRAYRKLAVEIYKRFGQNGRTWPRVCGP